LNNQEACAAAMSDAQACFYCFSTKDWCAGCNSFYPGLSECEDKTVPEAPEPVKNQCPSFCMNLKTSSFDESGKKLACDSASKGQPCFNCQTRKEYCDVCWLVRADQCS
jgi:hypothetical protein